MAEEIKDISLSHRKNFRIDGDDNRMLSLDVSDMNVLTRLEEAYPRMQKFAVEASDKVSSSKDVSDEESLNEFTELLKDIDKKMRDEIDYIFDSNVSEVCVPSGTMYDPYNGQFRFEHIISVLTDLYANNLTAEFKKMQTNVKKHTAKYTSKRKR